MHLANVLYGPRCFFTYHYTIVKHFMKKITTSEFILFLLCIIPTVLLLVLNCVILFIFACYKFQVYVLLKIRYGSKFIKFVPGCGVATSYHSKSYHHISIVVRLTTRLSGNDLFEQVNERMFQKFFATNLRRDLLSLIRTQMGYRFVLHVPDLEIEEVFREIKTDNEKLSEEELQVYMNKYFGSAMPRNNELAWDIALCTTPLTIDSDELDPEEKTYVAFIRISHAMGDGLVFYNLLSNAFLKSNEATVDYVNNLTKPNAKVQKIKSCPSHVVNMMEPPFSKRETIWSGDTLNSGYYISAQRDCLWKITQIRRSMPGISFLNVIIAAYTASLSDYFQKYHPENIPPNISIACPLQLDAQRIRRMMTEGGTNDFNNDFSACQIIAPLVMGDDTRRNLLHRLRLIQEEFERVFDSFDIQALYVNFVVFLNVLPLPCVRAFFSHLFYCTMISSVPGGPNAELFNGVRVSFPAFFLPMQHIFGIAMSVLTYDEKIQLGFTFDGKVFDQEKMHMITTRTFDYINFIHEDCITGGDVVDPVSRL